MIGAVPAAVSGILTVISRNMDIGGVAAIIRMLAVRYRFRAPPVNRHKETE